MATLCLDEGRVQALLEGALSASEAADADAHIDGCDGCRRLLAEVARGLAAQTATDATLSVGKDAALPAGAGTTVGRYRIIAPIGSGAMGVVYEAHDPELDRKVALKLVQAARGDSDGSTRTRVQREAKAIARLAHPNVVAVFDVGTHQGEVFLAMELVDGGTLRDELASRAHTWRETVDLFAQAGRGLAAAHAVGLVHRDFKPDNVLVGKDGRARVCDFGLARADEPAESSRPPRSGNAAVSAMSDTMTRTGTILGTPAYMAPEQMRGEHADARADVFSFSVALYEALYGERPFGGRTLDELCANIEAGRVKEAPRGRSVPDWLRAVVLRGLEAKPAERYASMDALLRDLATEPTPPSLVVASDAPGPPATHAGNSPRAPRSTRTAWLAFGAAAVAAALGLLAWRGVAGTRSPPVASIAPPPLPAASAPRPLLAVSAPRRLTFADGCEEYPTFTPDGRGVVYDASFGADSHIMLLDLASGTSRAITNDPGWQYWAALSPDGARVAYLAQNGDDMGAWLVAVDRSAPPRKLASGQANPLWTPDGKAVWAGGDKLVERVDLATGEVSQRQTPPDGYALAQVLELDDGRLVSRLYDRESHEVDRIVLFPRAAAEPIDLWRGVNEDVLAPARDRRSLIVSKTLTTNKHELWSLPVDGAPPFSLGAAAVEATKGLAFSPDRKHLAWSTCVTESVVSALGADGGASEPLFPKHEWSDLQGAGVPGTTRLLVISDRSGALKPWVLDVAGHEPPRELDVGDHEVSDPAMSPDGRWVAFTSKGRGIEVMPMDGSQPLRQLTRGASDVMPSFSRDGARIFYETHEGTPHAIAAVSLAEGDAGAPTIVIEHALMATASPRDDLLAYLIGDDYESCEARVFDLASGRSTPLSPSVKKGFHPYARFSEDGARVAVLNGLTEIVEIDAKARTLVTRFTSADQIQTIAYAAQRLTFTASVWRGDLWMADVEER